MKILCLIADHQSHNYFTYELRLKVIIVNLIKNIIWNFWSCFHNFGNLALLVQNWKFKRYKITKISRVLNFVSNIGPGNSFGKLKPFPLKHVMTWNDSWWQPVIVIFEEEKKYPDNKNIQQKFSFIWIYVT